MTATLEPSTTGAGPDQGAGLTTLLLERGAATPDRVALRKKHLGRWRTYTWAQYADRTAVVARGLHELGVGRGDRVAILSDNRPWWCFADLAAQALGAVAVAIDPTAEPEEVLATLRSSGAKVVVAEDEEQVDKVLGARSRPRGLQHVVVIDPRGVDLANPAVVSAAALEERGRAAAFDVDLAARAAAVHLDEPAVFLGGEVRSHRELLALAASAPTDLGVEERTEVLSYLPLGQLEERVLTVVAAVVHGYVVSFGEGAETFTQDLREVQPTVFFGIPLVWEKLLATVEERMEDAGWLKRAVYRRALASGRTAAAHRRAGRWGPLDRVRHAVGWVLLYRPLRVKLGLARVRSASAGPGPVAPEVVDWWWAIGVPLRAVGTGGERT